MCKREGLNLEISIPQVKRQPWCQHLKSNTGYGRRHTIPEAHWPPSLEETVSYRFGERGEGETERGTERHREREREREKQRGEKLLKNKMEK